MMPARPPKLIVLVGLPGAGKSTAGIGLARKLGWEFVDLDTAIEERLHQKVSQIFAERGEAAFRAMERDLTAELSQRTRLVISAGGGWMSNREASALLRPHARFIYLRVAPATALARLGAGLAARPLLSGDDPLLSLSALLEKRRGDYELADAVLDTEALDSQEVIETLHTLARNSGVKSLDNG
jgi:shikimate kinase